MRYVYLLLLIIINFTFQSVSASSIAQVDTTYLVNKSELVFEGEVVSTRSEQVASAINSGDSLLNSFRNMNARSWHIRVLAYVFVPLGFKPHYL